VVAFAGSGKTTALHLLALADSTPALYLAYNKSTQLAAQQYFPAQVACRTMHSLAFRVMRMFEQQHRLERKLTGCEVAEVLAIPALDGLRPSFWGHCVVVTVRSFTPRHRARDRRPASAALAARARSGRDRDHVRPPALGRDV
jgi:hypothetical protein